MRIAANHTLSGWIGHYDGSALEMGLEKTDYRFYVDPRRNIITALGSMRELRRNFKDGKTLKDPRVEVDINVGWDKRACLQATQESEDKHLGLL